MYVAELILASALLFYPRNSLTKIRNLRCIVSVTLTIQRPYMAIRKTLSHAFRNTDDHTRTCKSSGSFLKNLKGLSIVNCRARDDLPTNQHRLPASVGLGHVTLVQR